MDVWEIRVLVIGARCTVHVLPSSPLVSLSFWYSTVELRYICDRYKTAPTTGAPGCLLCLSALQEKEKKLRRKAVLVK